MENIELPAALCTPFDPERCLETVYRNTALVIHASAVPAVKISNGALGSIANAGYELGGNLIDGHKPQSRPIIVPRKTVFLPVSTLNVVIRGLNKINRWEQLVPVFPYQTEHILNKLTYFVDPLGTALEHYSNATPPWGNSLAEYELALSYFQRLKA